MTTASQAILFGVAIAYAPMAAILVFILWRDGSFSLTLPRRAHPEILFNDLASDLRTYADSINQALISREELASRLRVVESCRAVLIAVGYSVCMNRAPAIIEDDEGDDA